MRLNPSTPVWTAAALALSILARPAAAADAGPPAPDVIGHQQVQIDPKLLDQYAGYYQLGADAVLTVAREGDHLSVQLTGQPAAAVFPESSTRFFAKVVAAQFTFHADAGGKVSEVALHQNGADLVLPRIDPATAQRIAESTAARVKAQAPSAGTEAAVRALDASLAGGRPDYAGMSPALATATRAQLPRLQGYLAGLGPIETVRFLGVNGQGADVYDVRHAKGITHWTIALGADGEVATAWVMPGP